MNSSLRQFWFETLPAARVALVVAAASLLVTLLTFGGLGFDGIGQVTVVLHLCVVALGFYLFARTGYHHVLTFRARGFRPRNRPRARILVYALVVAILYLAIVAVIMLVRFGEGSPELQDGAEVWVRRDAAPFVVPNGTIHLVSAWGLRVFSAIWLAASLGLAIGLHRNQERIEQLKAFLRRGAP